MEELRAAVQALGAELESFGAGVGARLQAVQGQLESFSSSVEGSITELRSSLKETLALPAQAIDQADAELAELEP